MQNLNRISLNRWRFGIAFAGMLLLYPSIASCGESVEQIADRWRGYGIIDVHGHIGSFQGFAISKEALAQNVEKYGVEICLVSNIDCADMPGFTARLDENSANSVTESFVRHNPQRYRGIIWVHPKDGHIEVAKRFAAMRMADPAAQVLNDANPMKLPSPKLQPAKLQSSKLPLPKLQSSKLQQLKSAQKRVFVGMKFHPEYDQYAANDKSVDAFLSLCSENSIPAVFHCGKSGTNSDALLIYAAAKRHPKLPVVLYHMGFSTDHSSAIAVVEAAIRRGDANLYLETAQCKPQDVLTAIQKVGAKRVLFGTDATYFGNHHYEAYYDMIDALKQNLSEADFNLVVRDNALRIFPL